ncbi:hypothetical protein DPMN_144422 [Dreissena polymorpha]|uniref:Uncharacterized protein n=1 Tax=Dreissena polymorpha TaxID=45954 RepID=A0A9D4JKN1_DREPO|nr:hypothetical protein DPMN_144422 [Dreissena polymorpha]
MTNILLFSVRTILSSVAIHSDNVNELAKLKNIFYGSIIDDCKLSEAALIKTIANLQEQLGPIKPVTMELLVSVDIKQTGHDKEPFLTGLDFLPDGRLVAVDNEKVIYIIMDDRLQRL